MRKAPLPEGRLTLAELLCGVPQGLYWRASVGQHIPLTDAELAAIAAAGMLAAQLLEALPAECGVQLYADRRGPNLPDVAEVIVRSGDRQIRGTVGPDGLVTVVGSVWF